VAVALGRCNEAIAHLQRACKDREPSLLFLKSLPWFRRISGRPEFKEILQAVGP
jgi:hypothetical protein